MIGIVRALLQVWEVSAARKRYDRMWNRIGDGAEVGIFVREIAVTVNRQRRTLDPANLLLLTVQEETLNCTSQAETASRMHRLLGLCN